MLTVKYDDFSGGYWGDASDARPNQDNKWYGRNVRVYPNGQIGPRYATAAQTLASISSLGIATVAAVNTTASPYAIATSDNGAGDTHFYRFSGSSSTTWTFVDNGNIGTGAVPSGYVIDERNGKIGFGGVNKSFTIGSTTAGTFTTAKYVAKHGERAVGTDATVKSRMLFSDASDYYTWGASSFIDIGDGAENIGYVSASNNQLYVAKTNGIWLVSGVLGATATVRKMASVNIKGGQQGYRSVFVRSSGGLVAFVRDDGVPCVFDGARVIAYPEQGAVWEFVSSLPGGYIAYYLRGTAVNDVLLREPAGAFSRHTFTANGSNSGRVFPNYAEEKYQPDNSYFDQYVWIGDHNKMHRWIVAMPAAVYGNQPAGLSPDFPVAGNTNDYSVSGQLQGVFYLPEYYSAQGKVLRVRNVTVQFTKYKTTTGLTNEITAQAVAKGSYESGDVTSTALTWSESSDSSATTGTEDSVRFGFGDQGFGNGFQIQFTSLKGVTIKEVSVQCDERNRRT